MKKEIKHAVGLLIFVLFCFIIGGELNAATEKDWVHFLILCSGYICFVVGLEFLKKSKP